MVIQWYKDAPRGIPEAREELVRIKQDYGILRDLLNETRIKKYMRKISFSIETKEVQDILEYHHSEWLTTYLRFFTKDLEKIHSDIEDLMEVCLKTRIYGFTLIQCHNAHNKV